MVGAHASFTLSDETLAACVGRGRRVRGRRCTCTPPRTRADERDAVAAHGLRVAARLARAGALDERTLLAHGVHLDDGELELVRSAGASVAHNARSNMNNSVGRARVEALGAHVALGTDGIGSDMFEESHAAFFRLKEDDLGAGAGWPLAPLAEGARLAGRAFGEPLLGTLEPGAPADLAVLDYAAPAPLDAASFAGHWIFGLSARTVRDVMVGGRMGRDRPAPRAPRPATACRRGAACRQSASGGDSTGSSRTGSSRGEVDHASRARGASRSTCRTSTRSATGWSTRSTPRQRGFEAVWQAESRLVREATVPMAAYAAVTSRIGDRLRRRQHLDAQRRAARGDVLDARRPRARARQARDRRLVGPARREGRDPAGTGRSRRCARPSRSPAGCSRWSGSRFHGEFVQMDDVEIDIVHGDRSPKQVPIYIGATAMKMMALAGEIGDGVLLNYLVGPEYNRAAMAALAEGGARVGRTVDDIDRPQLVVCSIDDDRSVALDRARELVTQYLGQQPHIMKASGVDPSLLEEIGAVLTWPATAEQIEQAMHLVPDAVVQLITASGTPDECRAKVREYVEHGCTCPILYPLGDDVPAMIDAFADGRF